MHRIVLAVIALLLTTPLLVNAQEDRVAGIWSNEDGKAHIRVFKATNGFYYGKIEWMKNPEKLDKENPDPEKQTQPLLGQMILKSFEYDADKEQWNGGTIYDPDSGKTYDCFMWFEEDPNVLLIKGYVLGMKFMGKSTKWTSVK